MALHGAEVQVGDIDLLMSRTDAVRLLDRLGRVPAAGSAHDKFRSDVFGRLECGDYTVEVMGGFHVRDGANWRKVSPRSRVSFAVGGGELFAPSVEGLIEMCSLFGRPKDAERELVLRALHPPLEGEGDHAKRGGGV